MGVADRVQIAIVGSGPAGLSAAAHAAELGVSHVLLERGPAHANTIQEYQKGKPVMAEPGYLPLRSPVPFEASTREEVLGWWGDTLSRHGVNVRYNAEIVQISGERGAFMLKTRGGDTVEAEYVVLAIGVAGNPRKVEGPGSDLPFIQYTLKDPDEYKDETIVVIGAGDAAIENALALTRRNRVCVVNRSDEFARAKEGNLQAILKAIDEKKITCYYLSGVARVEATPDGEAPCLLVLKSGDNEEIKVPCHRIIARIGAIPPRKFVEGCGIRFPGSDAAALPQLSSTYESNVPGLHIIGALGGYPLIKQALNQGYEVVEYILGHDIRPADHELLAQRLEVLPYRLEVDECLALLRERVPLFSQLNALLFRELMLESAVRVLEAGQTAYRKGDFSTSIGILLDGEIELDFEDGVTEPHIVRGGETFGELSLVSGRQRPNTATARVYTILIETPRRTFLKLAASVESVREGLDQQFIARAIQSSLTPSIDIEELRLVARTARLERYQTGDHVFREGDDGDDIHLVRQGAVVLSRNVNGREILVRHVRAGEYFGEISLMNVGRRIETARAVVATETIRLGRDAFLQLMEKDRTLLQRFQSGLRARAGEDASIASSALASDALGFLLKHGAGEATDVLIVDDTLCIGCDNCEAACAETHDGISRLNRKEGPAFATIHIATACRHCENPHCMKDCPPNAIHRESTGEVYIDYDTCIGCGNCQRNCPYGVVRMEVKRPEPFRLLPWLLAGLGRPPGDPGAPKQAGAIKKAVKCDLCKGLDGGPACARACPTGAARRVPAWQLNRLAREVRP